MEVITNQFDSRERQCKDPNAKKQDAEISKMGCIRSDITKKALKK